MKDTNEHHDFPSDCFSATINILEVVRMSEREKIRLTTLSSKAG